MGRYIYNILLFILLLFTGCTKQPALNNCLQPTSVNIQIIQDSVIENSDLSSKIDTDTENEPAQTTTQQYGQYNWVFYCFALIVAVAMFFWARNKIRE